MQVMLCATFTFALVVSFCQARYAQAPDINKNLVSQMGQGENAIRNSKMGHTMNLGRQSGEPMHMRIDLPEVQKGRNNVTKAIPEKAFSLHLTILANDITRAGLKDALEDKGPFTLFGPTNDAFRNLPKPIQKALKDKDVLARYLKFHVLKGEVRSGQLENELLAKTLLGENLRVNVYKRGQKVIATAQCAPLNFTGMDNNATNGVIHVVDSVLTPPAGHAVAALSAHKEFSTLVKAVKVAGLEGTLSMGGPFTIFAPTNDAFSKLPPGTLHKLLMNPEELAKILEYHVVRGTYCSCGLFPGDLTTVEGQDVKVKVSGGEVTVNNAKVILADGSITNGVVHVIDTVLLPPVPYL